MKKSVSFLDDFSSGRRKLVDFQIEIPEFVVEALKSWNQEYIFWGKLFLSIALLLNIAFFSHQSIF